MSNKFDTSKRFATANDLIDHISRKKFTAFAQQEPYAALHYIFENAIPYLLPESERKKAFDTIVQSEGFKEAARQKQYAAIQSIFESTIRSLPGGDRKAAFDTAVQSDWIEINSGVELYCIFHSAIRSLPEMDRRAALDMAMKSKWFAKLADKMPETALQSIFGDAIPFVPEIERQVARDNAMQLEWYTKAAQKDPWAAIRYTSFSPISSLPAGKQKAAFDTAVHSAGFRQAAQKQPEVVIKYILCTAIPSLPEGERKAVLGAAIQSEGFTAFAQKQPEVAIESIFGSAIPSLPKGEQKTAFETAVQSAWFEIAAQADLPASIKYILYCAIPFLSETERKAALDTLMQTEWYTKATQEEPGWMMHYTFQETIPSLPKGERAAALYHALLQPVIINTIKENPDEFLNKREKWLACIPDADKPRAEKDLKRIENLYLRSVLNPLTWGPRLSTINITNVTINIFSGRDKGKAPDAVQDIRRIGQSLENLSLHVAFNKEAQAPVVRVVNLRAIIDETKAELEKTAGDSVARAALLGSLSEVMNYVGCTIDDVINDNTLSSKARKWHLDVLGRAYEKTRCLMKDNDFYAGEDYLLQNIINHTNTAQGTDRKEDVISDINTRLHKYGFPDFLCMN